MSTPFFKKLKIFFGFLFEGALFAGGKFIVSLFELIVKGNFGFFINTFIIKYINICIAAAGGGNIYNMIVLMIRTLIVFLTLNAAMRLMGKRQIGELDLSELITTLLISELASAPLSGTDVPVARAVVPILLIAALEVAVTFFTTHNIRIKELVDGAPSIIIRDGVIDQRELARQRIGPKDLLVLLRHEGIGDPAEVRYAVLEDDGKLSVFPADGAPGNIVYALVVEGRICRGGMKLCGKDKKWHAARLAQKGVGIGDVYLYAVNDNDEERFILKAGTGGA